MVAVRSINRSSCKQEETEFLKGLKVLTLLRHENVLRLRGFCCSRGRGECFLIYDYAANGSLAQYLDLKSYGDGQGNILDWATRVSIIKGIAKGNSEILKHVVLLACRFLFYPNSELVFLVP